MHRQLADIVGRFDSVQDRLHRLADALPADRWARRSDPARWSVAECVAHLNLTSRAYLPLMREALEEARETHGPHSGSYRRDPVGWLMSRLTGPLPRLGGRRLGRVRTPAAYVPGGELPRKEVMEAFDQLQKEQTDLVRASDGWAVHRVKLASPFGPRVRYSLYSTFHILPAHQDRHADQAEEVWGR